MKELHTPAGVIYIEQDDGMRVPFALAPNPYRPTYGALLPEETLLLTAEAECFAPGREYRFVLSTGKMHFCGADEDWQALCAVHNGYAVGIAARDPNDGALLHQDWVLTQYTLRTAEDGSGFMLHVLEKLQSPVVFHAAWLRTDGNNKQDCEEALGIWLT